MDDTVFDMFQEIADAPGEIFDIPEMTDQIASNGYPAWAASSSYKGWRFRTTPHQSQWAARQTG